MTLNDLAGKVSVTPSHLSEIENWNNEPSLVLAERLQRETGIAMAEFLKSREAAE
jgi:transcriptional regulator with XRE-family HTH domain